MMQDAHEPYDVDSVIEDLTRTLLYEGYALYPYYRSAVKNQKPIPFGVVYPEDFAASNIHTYSTNQAQCIVIASPDSTFEITVRFLHLIKIELMENQDKGNDEESGFHHVHQLSSDGKTYLAGWQTIERKISTGKIPFSELAAEIEIPFSFRGRIENKFIHKTNGEIAGQQIKKLSPVTGKLNIEVSFLNEQENAYKISATITNNSKANPVKLQTRDDAISFSFLSTHMIFRVNEGEFISVQNPEEKWRVQVDSLQHINSWPILIDKANSTMLASPIILYDYPQINPQSSGDLFDSTEIEEALLLHVTLLTDEERQRIAQGDDKLRAMLHKVSQLTPEEMGKFHSGLKEDTKQASHFHKNQSS